MRNRIPLRALELTWIRGRDTQYRTRVFKRCVSKRMAMEEELLPTYTASLERGKQP